MYYTRLLHNRREGWGYLKCWRGFVQGRLIYRKPWGKISSSLSHSHTELISLSAFLQGAIQLDDVGIIYSSVSRRVCDHPQQFAIFLYVPFLISRPYLYFYFIFYLFFFLVQTFELHIQVLWALSLFSFSHNHSLATCWGAVCLCVAIETKGWAKGALGKTWCNFFVVLMIWTA